MATFSYAQAAKGLSSGPPSSAAPSKPSSGSATPAKEPLPSVPTATGVMSWADDDETTVSRSEKAPVSKEPRVQTQVAAPKGAAAAQGSMPSLMSSPDLGASSASTVTKDDDASSLPNTASDSTWENKSQASTSVEKLLESVEKLSETAFEKLSETAFEKASGNSSEKGKRKDAEGALERPLQEAPIPVVNIWKQRAESAKAKPKVSPVKPAATNNGSTSQPTPASMQTTTPSNGVGASEEKASVNEARTRVRDEEQNSQVRKDSRPDFDSDKARRTVKGRPQEKEVQSPPATLPLPPNRDQKAWPTPDLAIDEDRKKAQDKVEKERKESSSGKPSGKKEWVNMAITPNVIFNTPLPNAAGSRRGGRGGSRGGAQNGGRSSGYGTNGVGQSEKDASAPTSMPNGDQVRRGRPDEFTREPSPKDRRNTSSGSLPPKDKSAAANGERSAKETDAPSRRASMVAEPNGQASGHSSTYTRQYPSRGGKGRRGDFSGSERRKDGDATSPIKENGMHHERRTSTAGQRDVAEDGERRASSYADGHPSQSKRGSGDRQYGTYSNRDRNRNGNRGGRNNFQNGHQYPNGHAPSVKNPSTYSGPLSPTSFSPEPNAFFSPPGRFRNGPRSQSVADGMYRAPGPYGGPQQVPPIQTFSNGTYDFTPVQPMSAVPFGTYAMDNYTLFAMVSTQLEYYFSLENLLKDMYLRKQMDSKGFVFLSVIAGFNRIKQLTTDPDMIKLVCYQSRNIEFRIGSDGKERLRLREGWEQWVLPMSQREPLAQNDGPDEVYNPPVPHPSCFDQNALPRYPEMPAVSPTGPVPFANQGLYPNVNGFNPGAPQHVTTQPNDNITNGVTSDGTNGGPIPSGHPIDDSTKAVSDGPDFLPEAQCEGLTVNIFKQDQS